LKIHKQQKRKNLQLSGTNSNQNINTDIAKKDDKEEKPQLNRVSEPINKTRFKKNNRKDSTKELKTQFVEHPSLVTEKR